MTVFGGAFGHRFKLMGFKRQSQPNSSEVPVNPPAAVHQPAAPTEATAAVPAAEEVQLPTHQHCHLCHSNSSNSTLSQQQQQQRSIKSSRLGSISASANGSIGGIQRPPRQQIIIPGDAENSKQSDDENEEAKPAKDKDKNKDTAGAAAAPEAGQGSAPKIEEEAPVAECPKGKHQNKKDTVCSCILLEQFADKVATPVVSEWHSSSSTANPANASAAPTPVALSDFKLARNRVFQGGQGVVYIVRHGGAGEELVMKFKERRKKQRTKSWKRDLREVFLLKDLRHPFIIELKHAYLTNTFYCLVMDYGPRGSLWSMVCRHGCMPKPIAAYYVACILSAVRYVHRNNFIFRDLKAENVVVMSDFKPKLIDFGMAKSHNKPSVRNTSTSFYFAAYIAPEVYADPKGVTEKVDSWGIGYLALELTVGLGVFKSLPWSQTKHTAPDWRFEMPRRYASRIGRDSCRFVEKALDRRPEKRPSLDQLMDFQFLEDIDFRLLPSLKPKGIEAYLAKKPDN